MITNLKTGFIPNEIRAIHIVFLLIFLDLSPPNLKTKKVFAEVDIELVFDKLDSSNFQKKKNA